MSVFNFKEFSIHQDKCAMKIGTDGVLLGAWANLEQSTSILDIGTGTGLLALMAAQRNPSASIDALEIDKDAAQQASSNFEQSPWSKRLSCTASSLQTFYQNNSTLQYDTIIANPPYFDCNSSTRIKLESRRNARTTELLPPEELLRIAFRFLHPLGSFSLILPTKEGAIFLNMAAKYTFHIKRKVAVIPKIGKAANRLLIELTRYPTIHCPQQFTIRTQENTPHNYTQAFKKLHKRFYLFL